MRNDAEALSESSSSMNATNGARLDRKSSASACAAKASTDAGYVVVYDGSGEARVP